MIAAANDRLFAQLCERIGLPELADDPRFRTNPDRLANRDALLPPIRARLAEQPSAHWLEVLEGIPVAPISPAYSLFSTDFARLKGVRELIAPGAGGAAIAAKPGYPTVIVPFGLVPNDPKPPFPDGFDAKPAPFGVSFTGTACSEPRLIELAYGFEQATKRRVPPASAP